MNVEIKLEYLERCNLIKGIAEYIAKLHEEKGVFKKEMTEDDAHALAPFNGRPREIFPEAYAHISELCEIIPGGWSRDIYTDNDLAELIAHAIRYASRAQRNYDAAMADKAEQPKMSNRHLKHFERRHPDPHRIFPSRQRHSNGSSYARARQ